MYDNVNVLTGNESKMSSVTITIEQLVIQESGTYNPVQIRPYTSILTNQSLNDITERCVDDGIVDGTRISGLVNNIIQPTATSLGTVGIVNGWSEKRVRFYMRVKCQYSFGSDTIYHFQGFSDWNGVSNSNSYTKIAPDMVFYINSYIKVSRTMITTPHGVRDIDRVLEAKHLIAPNVWSDNGYQQNTPGSNISMRPHDIFRGMQTQEKMGDIYKYTNHDAYDSRVVLNSLTESSRSHSLPTNYLAKIIDTYSDANSNLMFGQSDKELYDSAVNNSGEGSASSNPFIRKLSNIGGTGLVNHFTLHELKQIDPSIESKVNLLVSDSNRLSKMHTTGSTSYWNGSDRETLVATILSNSVPSIMMELMLAKIYFRSTNQDLTGKVTTIIIEHRALTDNDYSNTLDLFKRRLETEVIKDFTFNNEEIYSLEMRVDLFGETRISLSLSGGPVIDYVCPSYCDSLFVPVITNNFNNYNHLVEDFKTIASNISDNRNVKADNSQLQALATFKGNL